MSDIFLSFPEYTNSPNRAGWELGLGLGCTNDFFLAVAPRNRTESIRVLLKLCYLVADYCIFLLNLFIILWIVNFGIAFLKAFISTKLASHNIHLYTRLHSQGLLHMLQIQPIASFLKDIQLGGGLFKWVLGKNL